MTPAANPLDQVANFAGGVVSAARLRDRLARKEANATSPEDIEAFREAVADLEAKYPELADVPVGGAEKFARERGHGSRSRSPVHDGRRRTRAGSPSTAKAGKSKPAPAAPKKPERKPVPGLDPAARRTRSPRQAAPSRPTPRVDRAIRRTGIPAAGESAGSAVLAGLGVTIGLSLAFLVFSSAEKPGTGAAALPTAINGATRGIGRFLSLADVFPGNPGTAALPSAGPGSPSPAKARSQGKQLLPQVPPLPRGRHFRHLKPIHFPPSNVTEGG